MSTTKIPQDSSTNAESIYLGQKSILTLVLAKSGRGKSTSLRNLNPDTTFLINVMGKPLPFMSGMKYIEGKNMVSTPEPVKIRNTMKKISNDYPHVTDLIIDDAQYVMATEFMDKAHIKGFDKWNEIANNLWQILILSSRLRAGLKVFILSHEEETELERKIKTLGKLLDDKITPEGLSTIVLFGDVKGTKGARKYYFTTQSDGKSSAHTPAGMFPYAIPNDLSLVSRRIDEYYNCIELKDSKLDFNLE